MREVSYHWFSKDSKIPVLSVTGTETNGIFVPANAKYLYFPNLSVSETEKNRLIIYPNPVKNTIQTNITEKEILSIGVYNTEGRLVSNSFDVSYLTKGNYILKITTKNKNFIGKFIKK